MNSPDNDVQSDKSVFAQDGVLQDLAQAARSVEEAREQERQTLARELHDRVVQPLIALVTALEMLPHQVPNSDLLADWTLTSKALAREALEALRDVVGGLHTHLYEIESLPNALHQYLAPLFETHGLRVIVESRDWPEYLPPEWAFHLYLIIREAAINAERHGRASEIQVLLHAEAERLRIVISDNGVGFQAGGASDPDRGFSGNGLGIANMRERARLLGGELALGQEPGGGARVIITVPRPSLAGNSPDFQSMPS